MAVVSERMQRQFDALLAEIEEAADQRDISGAEVRVHIGINAGEPIVDADGDLPGISVVIVKRLESEAESGGILVSEVVRQAVAGKEFEFVDKGEVSLKGFDEPVRAWSDEW